MIKLIAFDLVGVLVNEKDIELNYEEEKLERMFGPNLNDADYLIEGRKLINKDSILMRTTEQLIDKIYNVRDKELFKKIKEKYPDIKIVIATNHVSYVRNFIGEALGVEYLDDVIISSEIHKMKPNADYYEHIVNKFNLKAEEVLFLDDNLNNVEGAKEVGLQVIKVEKNMNLFEEVCNILN